MPGNRMAPIAERSTSGSDGPCERMRIPAIAQAVSNGLTRNSGHTQLPTAKWSGESLQVNGDACLTRASM